MEVVEEEYQRLGDREPLKQRPCRAMRPVALVQPGLGRGRRVAERGKELRELGSCCRVEPIEPARLQAGDVVIQRVDEHPIRQVLLELGAGAAENDMTTSAGSRAQLAGASSAR